MRFCLSEEILQAHIDGELTEDAARRAMAHLAECAGCARRSVEARQSLSEISSRLDDHLPVDIPVERLCARVEVVVAETVAPTVARPSANSFLWRTGLVAASLLITVGVVVWLVLTTAKPKQMANAPLQEKADGANPPGSRDAETGGLPANTPGRKGRGTKRKPRSPQLAGSPKPRFAPIPELPVPVIGSREGAYFFDFETTRHLEKAHVLLRSFENASSSNAKDLAYDKQVSRELLLRNILLRREAEGAENAPAKSLLSSMEPLLLDIANLPARPAPGDLVLVKKRIRKSEIVVALQVYSTLTTALE
jgi:Putative zinc-finger